MTYTGSTQTIRLAPVLTGGASLAIWMGGVGLEFYRLLRASPDRDPDSGAGAYRAILEKLGTRVEIDILAGTSAGGLNAILLAVSQLYDVPVGKYADTVRQAWMQLGDFSALLREAQDRSPQSLLQGDEYFLKEVEKLLGALADVSQVPEPLPRIDLMIPATRVHPDVRENTDDFGVEIREPEHRHVFKYGWGKESVNDYGPHPSKDKKWLVDSLARVARTSASFPMAFEPSFVQRDMYKSTAKNDKKSTAKSNADGEGRFLIDGGILDNKPVEQAVEIIEQRRAREFVRRVVPYIVPEAPQHSQPAYVKAPEMPPLADVARKSLLEIPSVESIANDIERLRLRNEEIADQQDRRHSLAEGLGEQFGGNSGEIQTRLAEIAQAIAIVESRMHAQAAARSLARRLRSAHSFDDITNVVVADQVRSAAAVNRNDILFKRGIPNGQLRTARDWEAHGVSMESLLEDDSLGSTWARCPPWSDDDVAAEAPWPWGVWTVGYLLDVVTEPITTAMKMVNQSAKSGESSELEERSRLLEAKAALREIRSSSVAIGELSKLFWSIAFDALVARVRIAEIVLEYRPDLLMEPPPLAQQQSAIDAVLRLEPVASLVKPEAAFGRVKITENAVRKVAETILSDSRSSAASEDGTIRGLVDDWAEWAYKVWPNPADLVERYELQWRDQPATGADWSEFVRDPNTEISQANTLRRLEALAYRCAAIHCRANEPIETILSSRKKEWEQWDDDRSAAPTPIASRGAIERIHNLNNLLVAKTPRATLDNLLHLAVVQGFGQLFAISEFPAELMHVSADAVYSPLQESDDSIAKRKLAGKQLFNFAAFLKRSWRANDWMWGRLDAAYYIARMLADPVVIRSRYQSASEPADALLEDLDSTTSSKAVRGSTARTNAKVELEEFFSQPPDDVGPRTLPSTASYISHILQQEVLKEELPRVARAVRAADQEGLSTSSSADDFARAVESASVEELDSNARSFLANCKIGEETITDERGSDRLTRLAGQTAMVTSRIGQNPDAGLPGGQWLFGSTRLGGPISGFYWLSRLATGRSKTTTAALLLALVLSIVVVVFELGALTDGAEGNTWNPPLFLVLLAGGVLVGWLIVLAAYQVPVAAIVGGGAAILFLIAVWIGPDDLKGFFEELASYPIWAWVLFAGMVVVLMLLWVYVQVAFAYSDIERHSKDVVRRNEIVERTRRAPRRVGLTAVLLTAFLWVIAGPMAQALADEESVVYEVLDDLNTHAVGATLVVGVVWIVGTWMGHVRQRGDRDAHGLSNMTDIRRAAKKAKTPPKHGKPGTGKWWNLRRG